MKVRSYPIRRTVCRFCPNLLIAMSFFAAIFINKPTNSKLDNHKESVLRCQLLRSFLITISSIRRYLFNSSFHTHVITLFFSISSEDWSKNRCHTAQITRLFGLALRCLTSLTSDSFIWPGSTVSWGFPVCNRSTWLASPAEILIELPANRTAEYSPETTGLNYKLGTFKHGLCQAHEVQWLPALAKLWIAYQKGVTEPFLRRMKFRNNVLSLRDFMSNKEHHIRAKNYATTK